MGYKRPALLGRFPHLLSSSFQYYLFLTTVMHFAPFAALATIACAILVVALPVSDTTVLGVRAPEAVVARTESA